MRGDLGGIPSPTSGPTTPGHCKTTKCAENARDGFVIRVFLPDGGRRGVVATLSDRACPPPDQACPTRLAPLAGDGHHTNSRVEPVESGGSDEPSGRADFAALDDVITRSGTPGRRTVADISDKSGKVPGHPLMVHGGCALGGRSDKKLVNINFHPYGPSANGRSSLHVDASIAALPGMYPPGVWPARHLLAARFPETHCQHPDVIGLL